MRREIWVRLFFIIAIAPSIPPTQPDTSAVLAQTISSVSPVAIQPGEEVSLTVRGSGFDKLGDADSVEVLSSLGLQRIPNDDQSTGTKNSKNPQGTDNQIILRVRAPKSGNQNGINFFRLVGKNSVTNYFPISVDNLVTQIVPVDQPIDLQFKKANQSVVATLSSSQKIQVRFSAKAGDVLSAETEAVRLGSRIRPDLHLFDSSGKQIGWGGVTSRLDGDAFLTTKLESDGTYFLEAHDSIKKAPTNSVVRLKIGLNSPSAQQPAIKDLVLHSDSNDQEESVWNKLTWEPISGVSFGQSGFRHSRYQPSHSVLLEHPKRAIDKSEFPITIAGTLETKNQTGKYEITLPDKEKSFFVSVRTAELHSPLDPVLVVKRANGNELVRIDDSNKSLDPHFVRINPQGETKLTVEVHDLLGRGGDDFHYLLELGSPISSQFNIWGNASHFGLAPGFEKTIELNIERNGYQGDIDLDVHGPESLKIHPTRIPKGVSRFFVTLSATELLTANFVAITGRSRDSQYSASLQSRENPRFPVPHWQKHLISTSSVPPRAFQIKASKPKRSMFFPSLYSTEVELNRSRDIKQNIRLELLNNKTAPNSKENPIRLATKKFEFQATQIKKRAFVVVRKPRNGFQFVFAGQVVTNPMSPLPKPTSDSATLSNILNIPN